MIPGFIPYNEDDEPDVKWLKILLTVWAGIVLVLVFCWTNDLLNKPDSNQQESQKGVENVRVKNSSL